MSGIIKMTPEKHYEQRLAICATCEHKKTIMGVDTCGKCGCIIAAKAKFQRGKCPLRKWG